MTHPTPPRLLIVEGNVNLRGLLQTVLSEQGYAPFAASSVEEALGLVHHKPFDLILTDLFTRTIEETLDALRPLRALSQGIPVVVMASFLTAEDLEEGGFTGLLNLPFGLDDLVVAVAEGLRHSFTPDNLHHAEAVKRYVSAVMQGDIAEALALCTEDVRLYPWIVPAYPAAHPAIGLTAARAYVEEQRRYFGRWYRAEVVQLYPWPGGVAVRFRMHWNDPDGVASEQMAGLCLRLTEDGKISQVGIPTQNEHLHAWLQGILTQHIR